MELSQPLADLEWVPRAKLTPLRRLEIETVEDLLTHFRGGTKIGGNFRAFLMRNLPSRFVCAAT